ncbi:uncharacterized protein FIESC28_06546 [Fusarium coffeatum]|uniref:Uncharacterized protein n=1 Tax=Fusarium coffeatum TaxID=231269 RepID=A0A366RLS5_9HYPO|nr:uncharacterized protein FIESC28_06546 [Fusarium coffeatum]RBR17310.1 hypothetical protein FIESC28_06546 [Fusarium coffeatum]
MDAPSSSSSSAQQSPSVQMVPQPAPTQGNNPSTAPFLQDFTLIAEAAKRAQMAIMIRDFEDCGLRKEGRIKKMAVDNLYSSSDHYGIFIGGDLRQWHVWLIPSHQS